MRALILLFVVMLGVTTFGQEIERPSTTGHIEFSRNPFSGNYSNYIYSGESSDILVPTTSDTIDIKFNPKKVRPYFWNVVSTFNPITTADTIVYIDILGRNSVNEAYTLIKRDSSAAVTTDGIDKGFGAAATSAIVIDAATDTFNADSTTTVVARAGTIASSAVRFKYLTVRYILPGNDITGIGVELITCDLLILED